MKIVVDPNEAIAMVECPIDSCWPAGFENWMIKKCGFCKYNASTGCVFNKYVDSIDKNRNRLQQVDKMIYKNRKCRILAYMMYVNFVCEHKKEETRNRFIIIPYCVRDRVLEMWPIDDEDPRNTEETTDDGKAVTFLYDIN